MALDQNAQYPIGTLAPTADYPEGSAINETVLDALDGFPWEKEGINDRFGFEQALLRITGQAASGSADTALVSQYLQGVIELASGRATAYDDGGAVDAYVMDLRTGQQYAASLFISLTVKFTPSNTNAGASTLDYNGTIDALVDSTGNALAGGDVVAGTEYTAVFDGTDWRLIAVNEVLTSPTIDGDVSAGDAVLDEDDMASDSATKLATQQSIKAYVDTEVEANRSITLGALIGTSGAAAYTLISTIPSWAKKVNIHFYQVTTDGTNNIHIQIGASGGTVATGYASTSSELGVSSVIGSNVTFGFTVVPTSVASAIYSGLMQLSIADTTSDRWQCSSNIAQEGTSNSIVTSGAHSGLTGPMTQIRINAGGDLFDGGSAAVSYE